MDCLLKTTENPTGRVIANHGARLLVRDAEGHIHRCVALKKLGLVVTGDAVEWQPQASGDARVTQLLPRQSLLQRPDRRGKLKPVAANLTRLVIVSAPEPGIDTLLIDQYIAAAEHANIEALIAVNKHDLLDAAQQDDVDALLNVYRSIGYETQCVSARSTSALAPLADTLSNHISILVGQSGVGKSSIVQQLFPDLDIQIGALSAASGSGAHTTTVTSWYDLPSGGALIDSPGVRQFAIDYLGPAELAVGFREIRETAVGCRFNNCTHLHEPNCAVRAAVDAKHISAERYANYCKLMRELNPAHPSS
ncbi:MAG TPA: ribosome small subunit-dependent GTPase A [Gammaproteobacteria bacterium]|nr:ribosome small subunit-dependent GTPase A [Gammaproteobacteria bacterium]